MTTSIGVAFPAIVKGGKTLSAANVSPKWIGFEAEKFFEDGLGRDIHFANDADVAGVAEVRYGAARGQKGLTLLTTLGTGIGSALIYNGVLVPNTELGHLHRAKHGKDAEAYAAYSAMERDDLSWEAWAKRAQVVPWPWDENDPNEPATDHSRVPGVVIDHSPASRRQYIGSPSIAVLPGETAEGALMFVPSESIYAELHEGFDDILQKAYRSKVVIVSPSLLMLAIQVVQQIQKDARMREAADRIHAEVGHLMDDIARMHGRVLNLQRHFGQANEDVRQILISAEKVEKRATRIREVEFGTERPAAAEPIVLPPPVRRLRAGE